MECYKEFFKRFYPSVCQKIFSEESTKKEVDFIEKIVGLHSGSKILDLCSGHGRHAIELAKRGYSVVCQDFNSALLELVEENARNAGVSIATVCSDMRKIPFYEEFDGVINMWSSFGYLENKEEDFKVLRQVAKALKPSGKFLLDLDNKGWIFQHFQEMQDYDFGQLKVSGTSYPEIEKSRIRTRLFLREKSKKIEEMTLVMRYYSFQEIESLLISAGLQVEKIMGGFEIEDQKYSDDSPRMIILSQRR
jgi:ubiquinone/menaquinone biosynthesis C-methylase UbiE